MEEYHYNYVAPMNTKSSSDNTDRVYDPRANKNWSW